MLGKKIKCKPRKKAINEKQKQILTFEKKLLGSPRESLESKRDRRLCYGAWYLEPNCWNKRYDRRDLYHWKTQTIKYYLIYGEPIRK